MYAGSLVPLLAVSFSLIASAAVIDQEVLQGIPESGLDTSSWITGTIPPLGDIVAINDYQIAAKNFLQKKDYVYYRTASLGESTYINNMQIWDKVVLNKFAFNQNPASRLDSAILGYNFSAPFFIAPAAQAGRANSDAEANLVRAAGDAGILYVPSISSTLNIEEIDDAASQGQIMFHQQYMWDDKTRLRNELRRIEAAGYKAVFVTVDNLGISGLRDRNERLTTSSESAHRGAFTVEALEELRTMTDLPIVPKGLTSALDVKMCADLGLKAVYVSNHGGRQVDNMPTAVEVLLDLHRQYPEVFGQLEIYADGGVRHGTHVLMLLALGARAVGIARPFMFANIYGREGIAKMINKLRLEMETSMRNLGQEVLDGWFGNSTLINTKKIETEFLGSPLERSGTTELFKHTQPQ